MTRECQICQRFKGCARGGEPLRRRIASKPYEQYAVDLLELGPAENNARYMLVGVDIFSRFMNAVPIKDKKAHTVCDALEQRIFPTLMRIPDIIISDNGPEFRAQEFEKLLSNYNIKHYCTVPYLPHTNGRVERLNRTLQLLLSTACAESGRSWIRELPHALTVYNHSKHSQTGKSPSEFFCDERKFPVPRKEVWKESTARFRPYSVGELVGYKVPDSARSKLSERYQGPYKVLAADKTGLTYDIQYRHETKTRKAHYKQLKKWYGIWEDSPPAIKETVEADQSLQPLIISEEEQLATKINFAELFKDLNFNSLNTNERVERNSPRLPEEDLLTGSSSSQSSGAEMCQDQQSPLPQPATPPPSSVSAEEERENMVFQDLSPQMLTRAKRRQRNYENLRTRSVPSLVDETEFSGFKRFDSSTPHNLNVLQDLLARAPNFPSDQSQTQTIESLITNDTRASSIDTNETDSNEEPCVCEFCNKSWPLN